MNLSEIKRNKSFLAFALNQSNLVDGAKILCPFHAENTTSLHVSCNHQGIWLWKCWGCSAGGTVIDAFIYKYNLGSASEAIRRMEQELGVKINEDENAIEPIIDQERAEKIIKLGHDNLMNSFEIQEKYVFGKRAFRSLDVIKKYQIGFFIDGTFREWFGWRKFTCWSIPIRDKDGSVIGIKLHNEWLNGRPQEDIKVPKCLWAPLGTYPKEKPKNGSATLWPNPESFESENIYLCPGELKALAMIDHGFAATSITQGESGSLPTKILNQIKRSDIQTWIGVEDDDKTGKSWISGTILANGKCRKGIKQQIEELGKSFLSISLGAALEEAPLLEPEQIADCARAFLGSYNPGSMDILSDGLKEHSAQEKQPEKPIDTFEKIFNSALEASKINTEDTERNLLIEQLRKHSIVVSERDTVADLKTAISVIEAMERPTVHRTVHSDWTKTLEENGKSHNEHMRKV